MEPRVKNPPRARLGGKAIFHEYCEGSSVHGVRYFGREERTACERFWWIVVFLLSTTGCGYMIYKTYIKWDQNPIIVSFSEKATPVWEVPFPAVTICPETKFSAAKLNFTAEMIALLTNLQNPNRTLDLKSIGRLRAAQQVCGIKGFETVLYDESLSNKSAINESDVVNTLKTISLNRYNVVRYCSFGPTHEVCDTIIQEILSPEGICYSFNMLPEDKIFRKEALHTDYPYMKYGYYDDEFAENAPQLLNGTEAGLQAGLMLKLQTEKSDIDYMCEGMDQGYRIMLHEAGEYPHVSKRYMAIPHDHNTVIAIKPQIITTSQTATDYHWSKRQCFLNNERYLRFYQIYNQENCVLECLTNITLALCGCVRFSMPRAAGTELCALNQSDCMYDAKSVLGHRNSPNKLSEYQTADAKTVISECNCLPACNSTQFDVEVTQSTLDSQKFYGVFTWNNSDRYVENQIRIYFKESQFMTSRRTELYGMADFLANCGGLLGLFMGVSILSLLEICYYITIRPFSFRQKKRRGCIREARSKQIEDSNTLLAAITKVN